MPDYEGKLVVLAVDDTPKNLDVVKGILSADYVVSRRWSMARWL